MINYFTLEITEGLVLQSTLFHQYHDKLLTFSSLVVFNFYTLHIIFTGVSWPPWLLHKNFCHFEPLSEGANSILEKFPSLLQCFGPDLIPPLTSLRSVKGDTRRTGNADEDVETKRELLGKRWIRKNHNKFWKDLKRLRGMKPRVYSIRHIPRFSISYSTDMPVFPTKTGK